MPSSINVELRGYLDFFGLKNGGQNPQQPASTIAPVMDLQRWYLESRATVHAFNQTAFVATAGPSFDSIVSTTPALPTTGGVVRVPQSEIWLLLPGTYLQVQLSAHAGSSASFGLAHSPGTRAQQVPLEPASELYSSSVASNIRATVRTLQQVIWVGSGQLLYVACNGVTVGAGGSITPSGSLKVVRLQV